VISPARDVALGILLRVAQHGAFASELLHSERLEKLTPQDRGLCTELVMGVLRWRSRLDEVLASVSSQKLTKLDAEVLEALRLAAYQIGFLARIPAHAAVNESVELVKRKKKRSAAPFVNAVLRKVLAKKAAFEPTLVPGPKTLPDIATLYAHPLWMVERWAVRFGLEAAEQICTYDQQVPPTAIHVADDAVVPELETAGIKLEPGALLRSARRVISGDITATKAFAEGRVSIQDEASQLVAVLVGRGQRLLDCCAAPGGKTAILAERNLQSKVVAADIHEHRTRAMRERLQSKQNVEVVTGNATALNIAADFDRVLADVPCSGTGTLARHPEIKWRMSADEVGGFHSRQVAILRAALQKLKAGGRLVYSTCSLESEENEQVVEEVLRELPEYSLVDADSELQSLTREGELMLRDPAALVDGKFLRVLPGRFATDGFFAAVIQKGH
jgi:16S rRNA (cytosine967-C5)-methyltransferase